LLWAIQERSFQYRQTAPGVPTLRLNRSATVAKSERLKVMIQSAPPGGLLDPGFVASPHLSAAVRPVD